MKAASNQHTPLQQVAIDRAFILAQEIAEYLLIYNVANPAVTVKLDRNQVHFILHWGIAQQQHSIAIDQRTLIYTPLDTLKTQALNQVSPVFESVRG